VDHHVSAILSKLGVTSREAAGRLAMQHGMIPDPAREDGEVVKPK
jgi:DNA-binding NarL/FixJ family response regulator